VRVEYDEETDHANIYLELAGGPAVETVEVDRGIGFIHLHFNSEGHLYGIEALLAENLLPPGFLKRFANRNAEPS